MNLCSFCPAVGLYKWFDEYACRKHMPILQAKTKAAHLAKCARKESGANAQWQSDTQTLYAGGRHSAAFFKQMRMQNSDPARHGEKQDYFFFKRKIKARTACPLPTTPTHGHTISQHQFQSLAPTSWTWAEVLGRTRLSVGWIVGSIARFAKCQLVRKVV